MRLFEITKLLRETIVAYHGCKNPDDPNKFFDEFKPEHINSGEGAQSYGYGFYFSEEKAVARGYSADGTDYQDELARVYKVAERNFRTDIQEVFELAMMHDDPDDIKERYSDPNDYDQEYVEHIHEIVDTILLPIYEKYKHHEYVAEFAANQEDFLDWDAPLAQQRHHIKKLKAVVNDPNSPFTRDHLSQLRDALQDFELGSTTGATVLRVLGSDAITSRVLVGVGIPGTRYLDAHSRDIGEGTYNYVVFDPSIIKIIGRY